MIKEAEYYATVTIFECECFFFVVFFPKVRRQSGSPRRRDRLNHVFYFLSPQAFIAMLLFFFVFLFPSPSLVLIRHVKGFALCSLHGDSNNQGYVFFCM